MRLFSKLLEKVRSHTSKDRQSEEPASPKPRTFGPGRPRRNAEAPAEPGLYRILHSDGTHKYHGETNDLHRRKRTHIRTGMLDPSLGEVFEFKTAHRDSTAEQRREVERRKIEKHKPTHTKSRGGEGRIPNADRAADGDPVKDNSGEGARKRVASQLLYRLGMALLDVGLEEARSRLERRNSKKD